MKNICLLAAAALLVAFTAVNLFLPYAVLLLLIGAAVGFPCKLFKGARKTECLLESC